MRTDHHQDAEQPLKPNTIFIGGSRHVSRLPPEVRHRLDNVISSGHCVIVGDADGADKAVQKYLHDAAYDKVTVFCSGDNFRNNIGHWQTRNVDVPKQQKGFQFYAAKDREMASEADFGLMIWDGKSPGTVLNVLRLVRAGKIAVLFSVPEKRAINIKTQSDWDTFLSHCSNELLHDLRKRATPEEWQSSQQASFFESATAESNARADSSERNLIDSLNTALAAMDVPAAMEVIAELAKMHGVAKLASDAGLDQVGLEHALGRERNPDFAAVLKMLSALGVRLNARPPQAD
jgi:probable addiction module antidote protein